MENTTKITQTTTPKNPIKETAQDIKIEMTGASTHNLLMVLVPILAIMILAGTVVAYMTLNKPVSETLDTANDAEQPIATQKVDVPEIEATSQEMEKQSPADTSGIENDNVIKATDNQLNTNDGNLDDIKKSLENYNVDQIDLEIQSSQF